MVTLVAKKIEVWFPDHNFSTSIDFIDNSLTMQELLIKNGLNSRDGAFRYVCDTNGLMLNYKKGIQCPNSVIIQYPSKITQVWIDSTSTHHLIPVSTLNGEKILILGGRENDFLNVYQTNLKIKNKFVAYKFEPIPPFYSPKNLIALQVPQKGNQGFVFNPETGLVDFQVQLDLEKDELEKIRGKWSVWEVKNFGFDVTFRPDIVPIKHGYKAKKAKQVRLFPKSKVSLDIDDLKSVSNEVNIYKIDSIGISNALFCGQNLLNLKGKNLIGKVVAGPTKTRPALINTIKFSWENSYFVKVPKIGDEVTIFNDAEQKHYQFKIRGKNTFSVEEFRDRWVIVAIKKRKSSGKTVRFADIKGVPSMFNSN